MNTGMWFGTFRLRGLETKGGFTVAIRDNPANPVDPETRVGARFIKVSAYRLGGLNLGQWVPGPVAYCDCGLDQDETPVPSGRTP